MTGGDGFTQYESNVNRTHDWRAITYDSMISNNNGKKLALLGWHRCDFTQPAPDYECPGCRLKGHCHTSEMCREVNLFGISIKQTRQIIECSHCWNEIVVGSMDLPMGENSEAELGKFNAPQSRQEERVALRALVGREVKVNYSDAADDKNAGVTN